MAFLFAVEPEQIDWLARFLEILSIPALVALNAFFVAAEFSLVAVRRTRVEEMIAHGVRRAKSVQNAIENPDRYIAATQLGITMASLGLGWIGEGALALSLRDLFAALPEPWSAVATHTIAGAAAFLLVTYLHVVFGELLPKTIAIQGARPRRPLARLPFELFTFCVRPPLVHDRQRQPRHPSHRLQARAESVVHSVEELALLIEDTEEAGVLDADQAELVFNVFRLSEKTVADCMVSRERMAALELNTPPEKILEAVRSGAHTRMPVYESELDNILGIVNTKDLFYLFSLKGVVVLEDAVYPAIFLKPDEAIANALRLFRKAKRPMALVRDENGKIHGLITLEDILEEIVGDIEDEHDAPVRKVPRFKLLKMRRRKPEKKT